MLYELLITTKTDAAEAGVKSAQKIVTEVVKSCKGKVLLDDQWGRLTFAQPTGAGIAAAHFNYFIYTADAGANAEILRRLKINEAVLRSLVVKLSDDDKEGAKVLKELKIPYSKKHPGSVARSNEKSAEGEGQGEEKERRRFARRRGCWFIANKIKADWKDPETFAWLINEFGKISPARISGISRKHQRFAATAIKRARQMGIASYVSNRLAE